MKSLSHVRLLATHGLRPTRVHGMAIATTLKSGASLAAQMVKRPPAMWETQVRSWVGRIPWRRKWQPTPVFLPGESHGQRTLIGYSPWGCKESDMTERLHFHLKLTEKSGNWLNSYLVQGQSFFHWIDSQALRRWIASCFDEIPVNRLIQYICPIYKYVTTHIAFK